MVSTNFVTAKFALGGFNPETFSLVWTGAAAGYSLIVLIMSGRTPIPRVSADVTWMVVVLGVATGCGMILGWAGLARLDPSFASFLWRFSPVLTIAIGFSFLHEQFLLIELMPVTIMVLGGILSTLGRWNIVGIGITLTLGSCLFASIQMAMAKVVVKKLHPNQVVFLRVAIGTSVIAFWIVISGRANFDVPLVFWAVTLLGAFLGPTASFLMTFRAYKYWELSRSSMVLTAQPLIVLPLAYIFFHKLPVKNELIGGLIILVGGFWLARVHLGKDDVI